MIFFLEIVEDTAHIVTTNKISLVGEIITNVMKNK